MKRHRIDGKDHKMMCADLWYMNCPGRRGKGGAGVEQGGKKVIQTKMDKNQ